MQNIHTNINKTINVYLWVYIVSELRDNCTGNLTKPLLQETWGKVYEIVIRYYINTSIKI